ncbi:MAG: rhomboid family intramembrane serine protease [Acidobacteria bacterium]|nr:rhomboid family intramembrane serine protease [Acidobacteriota bacterium]
MLPLSDVIVPRERSYVALAIVLATTIIFSVQVVAGSGFARSMVDTWSLVPARLSVVAVVTSLLLHDGGWHLAVNMLAVWIFGENLEDRLGHGRFLMFFLLCGAAAALAHSLLHPWSVTPIIGASGAVAGVTGGYLITYPQSRVLTVVPVPPVLVELPAAILLALWCSLQVLSRLGADAGMGGIDVSGGLSLAGLGAGFATGVVACLGLRRPLRWD